MRFASFLLACTLTVAGATTAFSQAANVPIYHEGKGSKPYTELKKTAMDLMQSGALLNGDQVAAQLGARKNCKLTLPKPLAKPLSSRELYTRARSTHLRVGWLFQEKRPKPKEGKPPKRWTFNLSGGYVLTPDGAAVTCHHVVEPPDSDSDTSYLVAADDNDHLYPVSEILADNPDTDTCIFRIKAPDKLPCLPLATDTTPGDKVVCFSDPMTQRGYFSEGVVARFLTRPLASAPKGKQDLEKQPVWVEVSTEYAMGSSGSAVLDACGNAIGHVSEIESMVDDQSDLPVKSRAPTAPGTVIIFHDIIAVRNVRALITDKDEKAKPEK
jgi:hypothetical protein